MLYVICSTMVGTHMAEDTSVALGCSIQTGLSLLQTATRNYLRTEVQLQHCSQFFCMPNRSVHYDPYRKFGDNQYRIRIISEKFQVLVLIQKNFRTNCEVSSELLWIRAKFRESILYSSDSEDNSEWISELALNQTNSAQNLTWIRLTRWELGAVCQLPQNRVYIYILNFDGLFHHPCFEIGAFKSYFHLGERTATVSRLSSK